MRQSLTEHHRYGGLQTQSKQQGCHTGHGPWQSPQGSAQIQTKINPPVQEQTPKEGCDWVNDF